MNFGVRKLESWGYRAAFLRHPTFSRFDTIPECDGHTNTQTDRHTDTRRRHIPRLARRRAVKIGVGDYVGDDSPHTKTQNERPIGGVAAYA